MKNKIGVITSTYVHNTVEEALDGIVTAGFRYVELITVPGFVEHIILSKQDMEKTLELCKKYGLELFSIAGHGRLMKKDAIENFKKLIDAADSINVKYIDTDTGDVKDDNDKKTFYKEIKILGDYAKDKGITIGLEIHGDWCNNGKIASEIIQRINHPNIKITYDTANTIFYGNIRPEEDIKHAIPFLGYVHLKDKKGGYKIWDFPALGDGTVNFKKIFKMLEKYEGPMCIEVELDGKENPLNIINEAVKKSYNFLKNFNLF
jgi:L-ribulose-5-phosphate 3-epimerase